MKLHYELINDKTAYAVTEFEETGENDDIVVIPSVFRRKPVTKIGDYAFWGAHSVTNITIPESVTVIGKRAFSDCRNLTSIVIPNGIKSIGGYAFQYCYNLTSVVIPDSIKSIGEYAFEDCYKLTNITIPKSVTEIGDCAFDRCYKLNKPGKWKATNADLTCRGYKYAIGEFSEEDEARLCWSGYHFCENVFDLFNYYHGKIGEGVRFFEVETEGESEEKSNDSKRVCERIKLVREITSYAELLN